MAFVIEYRTGPEDSNRVAERVRYTPEVIGYDVDDVAVGVPLDLGGDRFAVEVGIHPNDMTEFVGRVYGRWDIRENAMDFQGIAEDANWSHMSESLNTYVDKHRRGDEEGRRYFARVLATGYLFGLAKQGGR